MRKNGILVPGVIKCVKNVIAMEYIGIDGSPAPHLKDVEPENPEQLFETLFSQIKILYQDAGLVHADFSEYNVLMKDNEPTIIDVGQAVLNKHPMAREFLERDLKNLVRFFKKYGILADVEVLRKEVVGDG